MPSAFAGDAFFVFMLVQFLRAIPRDMEEAARVDGANTWQTLIFIVVPLLTPALISVCLFQFMWTMNDFLGPLIYLSSVDKYPGVAGAQAVDRRDRGLRVEPHPGDVGPRAHARRSSCSSSPQKYFIEGISAGGVKG